MSQQNETDAAGKRGTSRRAVLSAGTAAGLTAAAVDERDKFHAELLKFIR